MSEMVAANNDNSIMSIINNAVMSNASIEMIERLIAVKMKLDEHSARQAFFLDLSAAKSELPSFISKDKTVDFPTSNGKRVKYDHESLANITSKVNPILSKYGLSTIFDIAQKDTITVSCRLCHRNGHVETVTMSGSRDDSGNKNSLQQFGSTVSYLMRYTLKAALGIAAGDKEEDDDGHGSEMSEKDKEKVFNEAKILVPAAKNPEELASIWESARDSGLKGSVMLVHLGKICAEKKAELLTTGEKVPPPAPTDRAPEPPVQQPPVQQPPAQQPPRPRPTL